jgi:hypothetical protein
VGIVPTVKSHPLDLQHLRNGANGQPMQGIAGNPEPRRFRSYKSFPPTHFFSPACQLSTTMNVGGAFAVAAERHFRFSFEEPRAEWPIDKSQLRSYRY